MKAAQRTMLPMSDSGEPLGRVPIVDMSMLTLVKSLGTLNLDLRSTSEARSMVREGTVRDKLAKFKQIESRNTPAPFIKSSVGRFTHFYIKAEDLTLE